MTRKSRKNTALASGRRHAKPILILLLATIMTCAFVWVRLQIVSISYDLNELAKQERAVREDCNNLTLKINEARSPRRLERLATTKFNMTAPRAGQVVLMDAVR